MCAEPYHGECLGRLGEVWNGLGFHALGRGRRRDRYVRATASRGRHGGPFTGSPLPIGGKTRAARVDLTARCERPETEDFAAWCGSPTPCLSLFSPFIGPTPCLSLFSPFIGPTPCLSLFCGSIRCLSLFVPPIALPVPHWLLGFSVPVPCWLVGNLGGICLLRNSLPSATCP